MDPIIGIDLGTTNSSVSIIEDGKPVVLQGAAQSALLPSIVGFASDGQLLVGQAASNQALVAPERTVKSIKRRMGKEETVSLADRDYSPQEVSAMILRTLKNRAEQQLQCPIRKAVITVPAYFNETQREATRAAGELAGLEVARIINEPTAAALTYQPHSEKNETLLVYDLGGGTFDVSIVQMEQGVIEVLASHGDTNLGGDDFDQLLLDYVCDEFKAQHGIDLREVAVARSRLLLAVEQAKKDLSTEAVATIAEEFIGEKDGTSLNLEMEISRPDYEKMIEPLLEKAMHSVDRALADAKMTAARIDRLILVGGSSRTPLVHRMLKDQLAHEPRGEVDPDVCVSMGAAIQGGLIAGVDVGAVLVDVTPHTLGIQCLGQRAGRMTDKAFSRVISRNAALPATRSEIYYTMSKGQEAAHIHVLQGEHEDVTFNKSVGQFTLEGLNDEADAGNEILVRFDLDLDGILTVSAVERQTGLKRQLKLENAIERFRVSGREEAKQKLAAIFGDAVAGANPDLKTRGDETAAPAEDPLADKVHEVVGKARRLVPQAATEDSSEIRELIGGIQEAEAAGDPDRLRDLVQRLEDLLFYVEDA